MAKIELYEVPIITEKLTVICSGILFAWYPARIPHFPSLWYLYLYTLITAVVAAAGFLEAVVLFFGVTSASRDSFFFGATFLGGSSSVWVSSGLRFGFFTVSLGVGLAFGFDLAAFAFAFPLGVLAEAPFAFGFALGVVDLVGAGGPLLPEGLLLFSSSESSVTSSTGMTDGGVLFCQSLDWLYNRNIFLEHDSTQKLGMDQINIKNNCNG